MAKTKTPSTPIKFWEPQQSGDTIKGKFEQWQVTGKQKLMVCVLDNAAFVVGVVMRKFFIAILKELKKGDDLKITYLGKVGRTKNFEVEYKGKKVEAHFSKGEPATEDEVDNFFADDFKFPEKKS